MKDWGIRARVLFLALMPSVMILLTLVTYFTYERIAEVDASLAQRGILVARQLAPSAEFALFAGDRAALQRLTDTAIRQDDVRSVTISDGQGHPLARSGPLDATGAGESVRFTQPVVQTRLASVDLPEQIPASEPPPRIGEIAVEMSRSGTRAQQQRLLLIGLGLGLACVLVAIALALATGNAVIRPIRRLAGAIVELGQGGRVAPLSTEGGGEFRTLSEGFNRMAARLQADARELEARINEATRALVQQKDTAEQATKAKSRFIAAASHDLRQPLHAIGLFTGTLQRRVEGTELQSVVRDLAQAVLAMNRLFDSLLDISKLDSGAVRADPGLVPLGRLFAQLASEYSDAARQKGLRLHVRPTTAVVVTDELLLQRLLANLVANAVRYTDSGTAMICCRRRGSYIQIEVRDSGIGIPADKQNEIFQEYFQIGNAARDRSMGLGLGLAIVSRLARLLDTRVIVRSAPGRGSLFALRLPRSEVEAVAAPADTVQGTERYDAARLPVLVVDDDELVLAGNRGLLEELGCQVTTVTDRDGAEAALVSLSDKPVLVLCDLWLAEDQDGIDLLRRLAALTTSPISGILISGDTRPETIEAARLAGYPLLYKPVSPAKLRAVVMHFAASLRKSDASE